MDVSSEFTCECGKHKGWIVDGEEHPKPCPSCGRRYRGQYNPKTLTIDAVVTNVDTPPTWFQKLRHRITIALSGPDRKVSTTNKES